MTESELRSLLERPEGEGIEFKPKLLARDDIAEYAVGIGNAGGGWLLMGVSDRPPRKILPIQNLSAEALDRIRESVADSSSVRIEIEVVSTSDGPIVAVRIPSRSKGIPYFTKSGKYLTRLGEGLRGLTPAEIDAIRREAGAELTALPVPEPRDEALSPSALEALRRLMEEAGAAADLLRLSDDDLLRALGVLDREGRLLHAGLLLAGKAEVIRRRLPHAQWSFRRMLSDTAYDHAEEGFDSIPVALRRLRELVAANNPIVTIPGRLVHPEFPRYPNLALRELLVNALAHRDYEAPGGVMLKLYPKRLELSNAGGFVGGVTAENILHHPSSPRYPTLFMALTRMRLANSANLGVPRIFKELLAEGKEPPEYWSSNEAVRVTVTGHDAKREFLEFVDAHRGLDVDDLLIVHYLTRHREITARTAAAYCQRPIRAAREVLGTLANQYRIVEVGGGPGSGRYYRLARRAYEMLGSVLGYEIDQRLAMENARARVMSVLGSRPLSNAEVREITQLSRSEAVRLMQSLRREGAVEVRGEKRGARWFLMHSPKK